MGKYIHFSLRLNRDNYHHNNVINYLEETDFSKYKSKTNFIVQAVEFYIRCINSGTVDMISGKLREDVDTSFVTKGELNEKFNLFKKEIEAQVYKDLFRNSVNQLVVPPGAGQEMNSSADTIEADDDKDDLSKYDGVMASVLSWSED